MCKAHRIAATGTPIVRLPGDLEVIELGEEPTNLVRHNSEWGGGGRVDFSGGLGLGTGTGGGEGDIGGCEGSEKVDMSVVHEQESLRCRDEPLGVLQDRNHQLNSG